MKFVYVTKHTQTAFLDGAHFDSPPICGSPLSDCPPCAATGRLPRLGKRKVSILRAFTVSFKKF